MRILILFLFIPFAAQCQLLRVSVCNGDSTCNLGVDVPINGFKTSYLNHQVFKLNTGVVNEIKFNSSKDGLYNFLVAGVNFDLIIFPEDTLSLDIKIEEKKYSITTEGSNAVGNNYFIKFDNPKPKNFLSVRSRIDKAIDLESIYQIYIHHVDSLIGTFEVLYQNGSIKKNYLQAVTQYIKDNMGGFLFEYLDARYKRNWQVIQPYYGKYMEYLDTENKSTQQYIYWCIDWYYSSKYYGEVEKEDFDKLLGVYGYLYSLPSEFIDWKLSFTIAFCASRDSNEMDWKKAHEYFSKTYPNSPFKPFLDKFLEPYYNTKNTIDSDIVFIERDEGCKTLKDLVSKQFKGKPVFIDLWATWCGPCRQEFSYSKSLHEFLKKEGVEMLYLSIDDEKLDKTWRKTAQNLGLKGYHYLITKNMYFSIWEQFYADKKVSVPRYFLVDEKGTILNDDMPRPSSMNKLYSRIKALMGKK
ncbi:MAG: TlpA family protein disulfide reductase [Bacteroidales bacterium]|nr:TlpA family protein disulfide reductase [Bacteroidales bacterium]